MDPSPRISSSTSVPDMLGIIASSRITSGSLGAELAKPLQGLDSVGRGDDLVALHLQPPLEHEQDGLGVVRDQQAGHPAAPAFALPAGAFGFGRPSLAIGSTKRKVAPSPGDEFAEIAPPCSSTSDLAIARPRPVPADRLGLAAVGSPEAVEDVVELVLIEARAVVRDGELDLVARPWSPRA